jgi:hypothetical protein
MMSDIESKPFCVKTTTISPTLISQTPWSIFSQITDYYTTAENKK